MVARTMENEYNNDSYWVKQPKYAKISCGGHTMEQKRSVSTWKTIYPICLLFAAVFLLLCTKSSPL